MATADLAGVIVIDLLPVDGGGVATTGEGGISCTTGAGAGRMGTCLGAGAGRMGAGAGVGRTETAGVGVACLMM